MFTKDEQGFTQRLAADYPFLVSVSLDQPLRHHVNWLIENVPDGGWILGKDPADQIREQMQFQVKPLGDVFAPISVEVKIHLHVRFADPKHATLFKLARA